VQINRGAQIAARAAEQVKLNTQLELTVGGSSGTLHFTQGSDHGRRGNWIPPARAMRR
jgi:hypothetical protein